MNQEKSLKVAAIQCDIIWESIEENLQNIASQIEASDAELIILPEMFATGFSMSPERIAQAADGTIVETIKAIAIESGKAIIFSAAIEDGGKFFNRLFFIKENGEVSTYNKRHLFRMSGENNFYKGGRERLIIEYRGFRICPLVCYDLRFPVFSRGANEYDLLIYIASWPESRSYPWKTLLRARAIENQSYCIGVNRVGSDPKNEYSGDSVILNFRGEPIVEATPREVETIEATLSLAELDGFKENFAAYLDADKFELK